MGLNTVFPKVSGIGGGASILFTGVSFVAANIVEAWIDGVICTSFVRIDDFSITALAPASAFNDTPRDVHVYNLAHSTDFPLFGSFYYIVAPVAHPFLASGPDIYTLTGNIQVAVATAGGSSFGTFFIAGGTLTWSKVSGPGTVNFVDSHAIATNFTVSVTGTYVIRCNLINEIGTSNVDTTVFVHGIGTVNAGADSNATLSFGYDLVGSVTDAVTYTWTKISGPGTVTFTNNTSLATHVNFSTAGIYTLRLTGTNPAGSSFDNIVITVLPSCSPEIADPVLTFTEIAAPVLPDCS